MSHPNGPRTGRPPVLAPRGMVSTPHYLASAQVCKLCGRRRAVEP